MVPPTCRLSASGWYVTRTRARRSPMRSPSTSSRRLTTCRMQHRRLNSSRRSVRVFLEDRIDRAAPFAMEALKQFLGRRDAARNRFFERTQVARLVAAVAVESPAPSQPLRAQPHQFIRQREHIAIADLRLEAELRHVVAQPLSFLGGP